MELVFDSMKILPVMMVLRLYPILAREVGKILVGRIPPVTLTLELIFKSMIAAAAAVVAAIAVIQTGFCN